MTRDYTPRAAHDALATLARWASVRRGEERHIFPYQENADVMLNSSLFYEISVLRPYAEKYSARGSRHGSRIRRGASRILKFLDNFIPIPIPTKSLRRRSSGSSSAAAASNTEYRHAYDPK